MILRFSKVPRFLQSCSDDICRGPFCTAAAQAISNGTEVYVKHCLSVSCVERSEFPESHISELLINIFSYISQYFLVSIWIPICIGFAQISDQILPVQVGNCPHPAETCLSNVRRCPCQELSDTSRIRSFQWVSMRG